MTNVAPYGQPKSRAASGRTQRQPVSRDLVDLARQLEQVKQQAKALGIFTDITDSGVKWPTVPFCECPEEELGKYRLAPGDIVFARIGATRRADQSADSSAHSEKQNGDTSPHVTIHKVK